MTFPNSWVNSQLMGQFSKVELIGQFSTYWSILNLWTNSQKHFHLNEKSVIYGGFNSQKLGGRITKNMWPISGSCGRKKEATLLVESY